MEANYTCPSRFYFFFLEPPFLAAEASTPLLLPDLIDCDWVFCFAQRAFCASLMRLRSSGLIVRLGRGADSASAAAFRGGLRRAPLKFPFQRSEFGEADHAHHLGGKHQHLRSVRATSMLWQFMRRLRAARAVWRRRHPAADPLAAQPAT